MSLKHAILVLLDVKPGTGYDIAREFDAGMGFMWSATHQQIYLELGKLADAGWADFRTQPQQGKPDKKIYAITDQGRVALLRWLEEPLSPAKVRDPLMIALAAAHLSSPDKLLLDLRQQKKAYSRQLDAYLRYERYYHAFDREFQRKYRLKYLALKHAIEQSQLTLQWLNDIEMEVLQAQLERQQGKPATNAGQRG